jgi:uncharacterized phage infection (PIP) family protein YhgE
MSESSHPVSGQGPPADGATLKEIRTLLWLGIICIWVVLALLLVVGTGNYQSSMAIQRMAEGQRFDDLVSGMAQLQGAVDKMGKTLQADMSQMGQTLQASTKQTEKVVKGVAQSIEGDLSQGISRLEGSLSRISKGQQALKGQVRSDVAAGTNAVQQSIQKIIQEQQVLLKAVQQKNTQSESRQQLLKTFFDNQKELLGQLSDAFSPPAPPEN